MKITQIMIDTLVDVIVDYPMCASESDVADIDRAMENVIVLEEILNMITEKFQQSVSPICK